MRAEYKISGNTCTERKQIASILVIDVSTL